MWSCRPVGMARFTRLHLIALAGLLLFPLLAGTPCPAQLLIPAPTPAPAPADPIKHLHDLNEQLLDVQEPMFRQVRVAQGMSPQQVDAAVILARQNAT